MHSDSRWYLAVQPKTKGNCCCHIGHPPVSPELTNAGIGTLSDEELEHVLRMMDACTPPENIARVISEMTGNLFSSSQIRYLSTTEQALVHGLSPDASSADKLVKSFQAR